MRNQENITAAYDLIAEEYAAKFWNEFENKPFDRMILGWFAAQIPCGEAVLEVGAGPGEVSGYLRQLGVHCVATDASAAMVAHGRKCFPRVSFAVEDFFSLSYADSSFHAVLAYYAIVNHPLHEVEKVIREVYRVLRRPGCFLFTFHVFEGQESACVRKFFAQDIDELTFYYFRADEMKTLVEKAGFQVVDIALRYPYPGIEYESKRAYFWLRKP